MKIAIAVFPPFTIVFCRVTIASTVLCLSLIFIGIQLPRGFAVWRLFLGMGILNNVIPFSLILFGQQTIGAGLASILNATTPLFTILTTHFFTSDEKLTLRKVGGIALGILGVVVLIGPELLANLGSSIIGQIARLGAAISYAFANTYGRRFASLGIPPLQTAFGQVTSSALIVLPLAMVIDRPWLLPIPGMTAILSIAALGVFCTALAYVIFFRILSRSGATAVALVTLLIPPSAVAMGAIFLGETLTGQALAGMGLIGLGLLTISAFL